MGYILRDTLRSSADGLWGIIREQFVVRNKAMLLESCQTFDKVKGKTSFSKGNQNAQIVLISLKDFIYKMLQNATK